MQWKNEKEVPLNSCRLLLGLRNNNFLETIVWFEVAHNFFENFLSQMSLDQCMHNVLIIYESYLDFWEKWNELMMMEYYRYMIPLTQEDAKGSLNWRTY